MAYAAITHKKKQQGAAAKVEPVKVSDIKPSGPPPKSADQISIEQFSNLRIVGSLIAQDDTTKMRYFFTQAKRGSEPVAMIDLQELQHSGVGVKYLSDCHALLTYKTAQVEVFCL